MYAAIIDGHPAFAGVMQVSTLSDMEFLVKESEIVTGTPGRMFLTGGTQPLAYSVHLQLNGYVVHQLDARHQATCTLYLVPDEFDAHALGAALREGSLFTPVLIG